MLLDLPTAANIIHGLIKDFMLLPANYQHQSYRKIEKVFKSILGTLNHILLADLIYRERLEKTNVFYKTR